MHHRKGLSEGDRQARSQLRQLLERADGFIHGSFIRMARRCGKARCRCALKGQKHQSWYLGLSAEGRTRMKYVPKAKEAQVRGWVEAYRQARAQLEEISRAAWKRLEQREE